MKHLKFSTLCITVGLALTLFEINLGHRLGYDRVYFWLLVLILLHFPFASKSWAPKKELFVISFLVLFTALEGLFWYLLNPTLGWAKLSPGGFNLRQPWLLLPAEYWLRLGIGLLGYIIAIWDTD